MKNASFGEPIPGQLAPGREGAKEIALATVLGAASSSCSYASAAISRTLFKKGAALIPSLAFLFASTNLVIELGIILYLLLSWQFMLGEWIGGMVLIRAKVALEALRGDLTTAQLPTPIKAASSRHRASPAGCRRLACASRWMDGG
jgi:uncharacterized protein